jgi:two-component system, chemotaxis family, CheB/CheR fusion protein
MFESEKDLLTGVSVLLVDDDEATRDLYAYVLTKVGASVRPAESASEALEALDGERFDVITSDVNLPDMDGLEFVATIRQKGGLIPAVVITGLAHPSDVTRSLASGFQAHLSKPVQLEALIATVAKLAGRDDNGAAGE